MRFEAVSRRRLRQLIGIAGAAATLTASAAAGAAVGGGTSVPEPPAPVDVACVAKCPPGERVAVVGSTVQISGTNLDEVDEVRFASQGGKARARAGALSDRTVEAEVPSDAISGSLIVSGDSGTAKLPEVELEIVAQSEVPDSGTFRLASAEATPRTSFFDGIRSPKVRYRFEGADATDVRIDIVDAETREVVASEIDAAAEPNAQNVVKWDGLTSAGAIAENGEYRFQIADASGGGSAATTADARFGFYKFRFPIAGKHEYGDGFGAGRNHQGQDIFAPCGTTLYAARGGRVQWNKSQAAAGYYLVIDLKGSAADHMYAHMKAPSSLQRGARVRTGQPIGAVGDSGSASGCHLHFEAWSAPGWYEGGEALATVADLLKTWDAWS